MSHVSFICLSLIWHSYGHSYVTNIYPSNIYSKSGIYQNHLAAKCRLPSGHPPWPMAGNFPPSIGIFPMKYQKTRIFQLAKFRYVRFFFLFRMLPQNEKPNIP